jgi:sulfatase maturation enzyme AslB (radical SAM superfamily)
MNPWCIEPFVTLENKVYGNWGLCCRSKPLPYSAKDIAPLDHFNSDTMKRIRKDMSNHNITDEIKTLCEKCLIHEKMGVTSRRQQRLDLPVPEIDSDGAIKDFAFETIEIKFFGNLCNLKCKMCSGMFSSSIAADEKKRGEWTGPTYFNIYEQMQDKDQFYSDMSKILPYTKKIKFTGGEPTMNQGIVDFITWISDNNFSQNMILKIITNGTRISPQINQYSRKFKRFEVAVSVDGTFEIDEYQRVGTVFSDVVENIKMYKHIADVNIAPVITALNVGNVPELARLGKMLNVGVDFSSIVLWPDHMRVEALPLGYRKELLESYDYPIEIKIALENPEFKSSLFKKLLFTNPDLCVIIEGLAKWI